ncbi:MAG: YihY/virulence factor BrkB family protein [Thermodesulfobacteriota bacterium]
MEKQPTMFKRIKDFLSYDLWRIRSRKLPPRKSFLIRQLRIIILAFRGFDEDKCSMRASALTYYSLMSVVPMAAMAFGIAKGFGLHKILEREILEQFRGQEEVLVRVIEFAKSMLETAKGGLIAGVGVAFLFYLIIKLLGNIEKSFNEIWGVTRARSFFRKISDYVSVLLIAPLLLAMSGSATVFIQTQIEHLMQRISLLGPLSSLILFSLRFLPFLVIWILFTFMYTFLPNTKVRMRAALVGGIAAGTIYELVQWAYIAFQVGVARHGAIYGSFAALPLFLIWLHVSWMIVLFGAEISFAIQNVDTYELEPDALRVSPSFKRILSLRIANLCVKDFFNGRKPRNAEEISRVLEIPIRLVNQILFELVRCGVLSEVNAGKEADPRFQPARNVEVLTLSYVLQALDGLGTDDIPVEKSEELEKIRDAMHEFEKVVENTSANQLLKDI